MEKTNRFGAFKPEDFIIDLVDASGKTVKYMTNQGRVIAFRSEYPDGKIRAEEKYYPELSMFVVSAYIYANKNDNLDDYLASDFGSRIFKDNNSLPEAATQAISRALGRCGFGTVYSSPDEGFDGTMSEAGIIPKELVQDVVDNTNDVTGAAETEGKQKKGRKAKAETPAATEETNSKPTAEVIKTPSKAEEKAEVKTEVKVEVEGTEKVGDSAEEITPETAPIPPAESEETPAAPAETGDSASVSLENMTLESAKKVKIPFGQKKGQFMGEVFATDPNAVKWYAEKYTGDNEEVRKSAQLILASMKK